jgi:hypothetical protein
LRRFGIWCALREPISRGRLALRNQGTLRLPLKRAAMLQPALIEDSLRTFEKCRVVSEDKE